MKSDVKKKMTLHPHPTNALRSLFVAAADDRRQISGRERMRTSTLPRSAASPNYVLTLVLQLNFAALSVRRHPHKFNFPTVAASIMSQKKSFAGAHEWRLSTTLSSFLGAARP